MMRSFALAIAVAALLTSGCSDNTRAKKYGGTMNVALPCGQKLVTATWKDDNLWYLTRPMKPGEKPEPSTFKEDSTYGLLNGTVNFTECAAAS